MPPSWRQEPSPGTVWLEQLPPRPPQSASLQKVMVASAVTVVRRAARARRRVFVSCMVVSVSGVWSGREKWKRWDWNAKLKVDLNGFLRNGAVVKISVGYDESCLLYLEDQRRAQWVVLWEGGCHSTCWLVRRSDCALHRLGGLSIRWGMKGYVTVLNIRKRNSIWLRE